MLSKGVSRELNITFQDSLDVRRRYESYANTQQAARKRQNIGLGVCVCLPDERDRHNAVAACLSTSRVPCPSAYFGLHQCDFVFLPMSLVLKAAFPHPNPILEPSASVQSKQDPTHSDHNTGNTLAPTPQQRLFCPKDCALSLLLLSSKKR